MLEPYDVQTGSVAPATMIDLRDRIGKRRTEIGAMRELVEAALRLIARVEADLDDFEARLRSDLN